MKDERIKEYNTLKCIKKYKRLKSIEQRKLDQGRKTS